MHISALLWKKCNLEKNYLDVLVYEFFYQTTLLSNEYEYEMHLKNFLSASNLLFRKCLKLHEIKFLFGLSSGLCQI